MSKANDALQSFLTNHVRINSRGADFDSRLSWWNRGWIELAQIGPELWRITALGRAVLTAHGIDANRAPAELPTFTPMKSADMPEPRPPS